MRVNITFKNQYMRVRMPHDTERVSVDGNDFTYIPNTNDRHRVGKVRANVLTGHKALPEVYRFLPLQSILLTRPLQLLWRGINSELSVDKWWTLIDRALAWCNMGAGNGPDDPKANYVTDPYSKLKSPSFDQCRFTGGAELRAVAEGTKAMITGIDVTKPLPTPEQLLASPWLWYYGTSITPTGRIYYIRRLGNDGQLKKVRIPIYYKEPLYVSLSEVHVLKLGEHYEPNIIVHK